MESTGKRICRRSSNDERKSDTATNVTCKLKRESNYWNSQSRIIHLPTEILEQILENLSYHEISKAREVCRRFRAVCIKILNRAILKINNRLIEHIKLLDEADAAYLKRFDPEVLSRDSEIQSVRKSGSLICRRWLLDVIVIKVSTLLNVCYRFLFLNRISPSIRYRRCFFAGKILDEVHRILTLVRSTSLTIKDMNVDVFFDLVNTFIDYFHDRIEPMLVRNEAVFNRSTLYGSKVVDILESCVDCEKDVKVCEDSKGWYHLQGEYKFDNLFFTCLSSKQLEFQDLEPLTVKEQRILHDCLFSIINKKHEWCLKQRQMDYRNKRPHDTELRFTEGCYRVLAECDNSVFYYGYHEPRYYYGRSVEWRETNKENDEISGENETYHVDDQGRIFLIDDEQDEENDNDVEEIEGSDNSTEDDVDYIIIPGDEVNAEEEESDGSDSSTEPDLDIIIIPGDEQYDVNENNEESDGSDSGTESYLDVSNFSPLTIKVELTCRKELAPLAVLFGKIKSSKEQHKHESLTEVTDHDLVLRLVICCPLATRHNNRLPSVYRCLIKQKYLQGKPLSNPTTSHKELAVTPSDNFNRSDIFEVHDNLRISKLA